ncbi:MAG: hypothetical protein GYB65_03015 [Chloroflexi bacterium]|nr:hypothetical protein [Chloroflexota bacterium]
MRKYLREIRYILLAITFLLVLENYDTPGVVVSEAAQELAAWGLVGIFIVNLVGDSVVLVHMPYNIITMTFALSAQPSLGYLVLAGIVIGVAAGIGRVIAYVLIYNLSDTSGLISEGSFFDRVRQFLENHPRTTPVIVFLSAVIPGVPNDTTTLPLALVKYPVRLFALPKIAGKTVHNIGLAFLLYYGAEAINFDTTSPATFNLYLRILGLLAFYVMYRIEKRQDASDNEAYAAS